MNIALIKSFVGTLLVATLFSSCHYFQKQRSVALENVDVSAARQGFEEGLFRKIRSEGGEPTEVTVEDASLNPQEPSQVLITYKIIYTVPQPAGTSPMKVTYKGTSTLQASRTEQDAKYTWHVVDSKQIDYAVEYLRTLSDA